MVWQSVDPEILGRHSSCVCSSIDEVLATDAEEVDGLRGRGHASDEDDKVCNQADYLLSEEEH